MREMYGHKIWTVEDLITELKKYNPTDEVGFSLSTLFGAEGFSLKEVQKDSAHPVVDLYLQQSYHPFSGLVKGVLKNGTEEAASEEF